jgi:transposase
VERNRRKRVRELADAGLSQRQIAEKLNVSERKVKRDVAKIRPYQERKFRHQLRLLRKEWDEQFEAELAGETPLQQLEILGRKIIQYDKALRTREYYHHQIYINIDLDRIVYGLPEVKSNVA